MPNQAKALKLADLTFTMQGVDHLYRRYLRSCNWKLGVVMTETEIRQEKEIINGLEQILLRSGYLTPAEIRRRQLEVGFPGVAKTG